MDRWIDVDGCRSWHQSICALLTPPWITILQYNFVQSGGAMGHCAQVIMGRIHDAGMAEPMMKIDGLKGWLRFSIVMLGSAVSMS